eukprot:m.242790 g.242790  ORF g.242790 m.242790 type:complete len:512 (+) comp40227_c0_seq3:908-2443(+)
MLQNHLTEMTTLISMELPKNEIATSSAIATTKLKLLKAIESPSKDQCIIGQYIGYLNDLSEDSMSAKADSITPTFAAALLSISNSQWKGVPFLLVSGKKLSSRNTYVSVSLKNRVFSLDSHGSNHFPQIIFRVNDPAILISEGFPGAADKSAPPGWHFKNASENGFDVAVPDEVVDPYTVLLQAIYDGGSDLFIDDEHLLELWRIWTPVIHVLDEEKVQPMPYTAHSAPFLKFHIQANQLVPGAVEGSSNDENCWTDRESYDMQQTVIGKISLLNHSVFLAEKDVIIRQLANDVERHAKQAISDTGVFHIAFPGGLSPTPLFQHLARYSIQFPWLETHVWLSDERCVPLNHDRSNFNSVYTHLLRHVDIPLTHVHPMPIYTCNESFPKPNPYEQEFLHWLPEARLDYVVLGIGQDGHVASLFPNRDEHSGLVAVIPKGSQSPHYSRMSFTYEVLRKSEKMALLVHGESKKPLIQKLQGLSEEERDTLPVVKLARMHNNLYWFVDNNAWKET